MLVIKEVLFNQLALGMFIYISPPLINHSNLKRAVHLAEFQARFRISVRQDPGRRKARLSSRTQEALRDPRGSRRCTRPSTTREAPRCAKSRGNYFRGDGTVSNQPAQGQSHTGAHDHIVGVSRPRPQTFTHGSHKPGPDRQGLESGELANPGRGAVLLYL